MDVNLRRSSDVIVNFWKQSPGGVRHSFKFCELFNPSKRQPHKMVNHTQTTRRQFADELFECV